MTKKHNWHEADVDLVVEMKMQGKTWVEISSKFPGSTPNAVRKLFYRETRDNIAAKPVKVLLLDIETAPMLGYVWGLFDQNIGLNQMFSDWHLLSWSAKWLGSPESEVFYMDQRSEKNIENDKKIVAQIWKLMDEADVIIGQNSRRFDIKKLNARFIHHGFPPPSSFRQIDTLEIAKRYFGFSSNKLEYMTTKFCKKHVKSGHKKFPGFELWKGCLDGNLEAWNEMAEYNKIDVLALEELYVDHLQKWDRTINFNSFHDEEQYYCSCGSTDFRKSGFVHSNLGRYERFTCKVCGKEHQGRENLLSKDKRKTLRK